MDVIEKPDSSSAGEYIWDDFVMAEMFLDNLYLDNLPGAEWGGNITSTDEALGTGASNFLWGLSGVEAATTYSSDYWAQMRRINLMIQEMNNRSSLPEDQKNMLVGQARFLRAIKYWNLVRLYGGVPILNKPLDPVLDDMDVPRSTTAECVKYIVDDLDFAIASLPANWAEVDNTNSDFGRLTKLAAMAYKGRVLLHFASPMFCERESYTGANYETIEPFSITAASRQERWQEAYSANKIAYDSLKARGFRLLENWNDIFITPALTNPEAIMLRLYTGLNYVHTWEHSIRPYSMGGRGHNINPTIEMSEAFLMADGKRTFDETSGYDPKFYWIDRDPRFYGTLVYNGSTWDMAGTNSRKQWIYDGTPEEAGNLPYTGFYCKKAQDRSLTRDNILRGRTAWIEIRMAEVMLNLAEAANETGHSNEAIELVREIRQRAGILVGDGSYGVPSSLSGIDLLDVIMNERFIELAFENQRYWDLRRRMMYTKDLSPNTKKLNDTRRRGWEIWTMVYPNPTDPGNSFDMLDSLIMTDAKGVAMRDTLVLTKANYYHYFDPDLKTFDLNRMGNPSPSNPRSSLGIKYLPGYYFMPIGTTLFSNSTKLIQTIGWGFGTYDPLQE